MPFSEFGETLCYIKNHWEQWTIRQYLQYRSTKSSLIFLQCNFVFPWCSFISILFFKVLLNCFWSSSCRLAGVMSPCWSSWNQVCLIFSSWIFHLCFWLPDICPLHFGVLQRLSLLLIHLHIIHSVLIRQKWLLLHRRGRCGVEIQWQIVKVGSSRPELTYSIIGDTEVLPWLHCVFISWIVPIVKSSFKR